MSNTKNLHVSITGENELQIIELASLFTRPTNLA